MENPSERRLLDPDERRALRRQRHESRAGSTYKQLLKDLRSKGFASEREAELALTSVLCALEQRLSGDDAFKFESQLPDKLKQLVVRCERHEDLRPRDIGRPEFLELVLHGLPGGEREAERATRAVFETFAEHVSAGEIQKVIHQLPADLRDLWPGWARAREELRQPPPGSRERAAATESARIKRSAAPR